MGEGMSGIREGSEPVPDAPGAQEEETIQEAETQLLHLGCCPERVALEIGSPGGWGRGCRSSGELGHWD